MGTGTHKFKEGNTLDFEREKVKQIYKTRFERKMYTALSEYEESVTHSTNIDEHRAMRKKQNKKDMTPAHGEFIV